MAGKKFRFSLQSVLTLRKYEAERARQTLGRTASERQKQEAHVHTMRSALTDLADSAPAAGRVDPLTLRRHEAFRQDVQEDYEAACRTLTTLQQREVQARETLKVRHRAEASLQTLHEQEQARHRKTQDAADTAFLDEQAITRFQRTRKRAS